jgi:hypothetical protein
MEDSMEILLQFEKASAFWNQSWKNSQGKGDKRNKKLKSNNNRGAKDQKKFEGSMKT